MIKNNIVKIADFGIGRFMDRDTATLTTTTEAYSSWGYAAPELINSGAFREGSKAIDIFALGSLAYYVFSDGSLPAYFLTNRLLRIFIQYYLNVGNKNLMKGIIQLKKSVKL